jgi:putative hydrolase of the HAD superfamily
VSVAAVLLDWGGTITPSHDADLHDLWRLAAYEMAPAHATELTARLVAVERQWWWDAASHLRSGSAGEIMSIASASLGVDVAAAVADATARRDVAAWTPRTVADPEALLLLHLLRARGLRVGLLTNTHWPAAWHARLLARDGLLELFDARVYAADLPVRKPHPMVFQAGLAALGVSDPAQVVHVGDRADVDVAGAAAVGMCTVLLADGERPHDGPLTATSRVSPDRVVRRLGQLLDALTSMERLPPTPRRTVELPAVPTL